MALFEKCYDGTMAQCPVCLAEIVDDFGLLECESCGAQLIVHVDGSVEHSGAGADSSGSEAAPVAEEDVALPSLEEFADVVASEPLPPPPEEEPLPTYQPPTTPSSPDLSDIADFGNSDSALNDGNLRYDILITGIDTVDVREAFREALTDRKFMWDTDQILRSLRGGEVRIQNVAASKAYILISRLRSLPVQVTWEQYAIHQT